MKPAKILFFITGAVPSAEEFETAQALNADVKFRNALAVSNEPQSLEVCDGVAGDVPQIYAEAFPDADKAIKLNEAERKALAKKVGDEPAPKRTAPKVEQPEQGEAPAQAPAQAPAKTAAAKPSAWKPNAQ